MTAPQAMPTSIRIFLADGQPEGIRVVDKSNWTGRAVVASRAQLGEALQREELGRPGVYALVGPGSGSDARIYVGEADDLRERIKKHATAKDFWTWFIAFSSADGSLNKAHVRYLESRLVELARAANQWEVENGNTPARPPLSEADRADAEWFLREMLVLYPILGVDAFEVAHEETAGKALGPELRMAQTGVDARGQELKDGFLVRKGSRARPTETQSIHGYLTEARQQLRERGVLADADGALVFTQDYRFSSPSTAAGVLAGAARNGRTSWHDADGRPLKALQDERAEAVGDSGGAGDQ